MVPNVRLLADGRIKFSYKPEYRVTKEEHSDRITHSIHVPPLIGLKKRILKEMQSLVFEEI